MNGAQVRRYVYDGGGVGNGNRTAEYGPLDVLLASATHDAQDRLTTYRDATYTWTAAGELMQRESLSERLSTTYDALGNLLSAGITPLANGVPQGLNIGTTITYRVDGQNRRVQRLVNGVADRGWLYRDGLSPVAELDDTGALLNRYVYGTSSHTPDLVVRGGVEYRVIPDHLGSIRMIMDATSGAVVQRLDYDAWGELTVDTAPSWQSLGYVSGIQDRETGLVRFGARDYEAGVGRWTAKDPAGLHGANPNLYRYVSNLPATMTDPAGLDEEQSYRAGDFASACPKAEAQRVKELKKWASDIADRRIVAGADANDTNIWLHASFLHILAYEYGAPAAFGAGAAKEADDIMKGLYNRNPHVFGETKQDLKSNWKGVVGTPPPAPPLRAGGRP